MERIAAASRNRLFAARIWRHQVRQRSGKTGLREIRFPRATEDMVTTTTGSGSGVDVRLWFDGICCSARERERRSTRRACPVGNRSEFVDVRYPAFFFSVATAYSRLSFAMKLALIDAGQTASHS